MRKKSLFVTNFLLLILVAAMVAFPLVYRPEADFGGADGKAGEVIYELNPGYEPWFSSVWEPPSGEVENLLFVLQGALGAGIAGYCLGYMKGKRKAEKD